MTLTPLRFAQHTRVAPLPRRWNVQPADAAWVRRVTPVREGEELLYYDGPQIFTQWSADNEEALWLRQDSGAGRARWWVCPLPVESLDAVVLRGTFQAAFTVCPVLLLVEQIYRRRPSGSTIQGASGGAPAPDIYRVHALSPVWLDDAMGSAPYVREVAEWARGRRLFAQRLDG